SGTSVPLSAIGLHLVLSPFPLRASLKYLASVRCGESSIQPEPVLVQLDMFSGRFFPSESFCPLQAFCPQTQLQFLRTQHPFDHSRELFRIFGVKIDDGITPHFRQRSCSRTSHGRPACHGLQNRHTESLDSRWHHKQIRRRVNLWH